MKDPRQQALLHVVQTRDVASQEELQAILKGRGFEVNVATISRDIRELGIVKSASKDPKSTSKFRYVLQTSGPPGTGTSSLQELAKHFVESMKCADKFIVIKTRPRCALLVGSELDKAKWPEVLGTIALHETIVGICKSKAAAAKAISKLEKLKSG